MKRFRHLAACLCLWLALALSAGAANTNSIVWHKATGRVDADLHGMTLLPMLQKIAAEAGWRVFVEPDTERSVSAKFKDLSSGDALKMLLGDLNFALVPQTNAPARLYVFRTKMENATQQVRVPKAPKRVANELLLRVKPGTDMDALAKLLGAKIVARLDKDGIYRLRFDDEEALQSALAQLKSNSDVLAVDYNYYLDPPPTAAELSSAPLGQLSLKLNPSTDSSKVVVGLVDTAVQSLGDLDKFISQRISVADGTANSSDIEHGTSMAETILRAIAAVQGNGTSAQIISVDVYGSGEMTTTWNVALGIQAAVNAGANVVNLSLGGAGESSVLSALIQQAVAAGIPVFAAAGNESGTAATYPAAYPGVIAVTALQNGKIASYANYGNFVDTALPGANVVYLNGQAYLVQGTSVSTAKASGAAAGLMDSTGMSGSQAATTLEKEYPMPAK